MSKHTPGPWIGVGPTFGDDTPAYTTEIVTDDESREGEHKVICRFEFEEHDEENEANAQLIATSPRMLNALKGVIKSLNQDESLDLTLHEAALIEVLNSIRQAEGKPEIKTMLEAEGL